MTSRTFERKSAASATLDHLVKVAHSTTAVKVVDEELGIVEAIVSVTAVLDDVGDIIEPGAYKETLAKRTPKGVWSHDWDTPISKTLEAEELMPGDSRLPEKVQAAGGGGLRIVMQFDVTDPDSMRAFRKVRFYGDEQEWSIGYTVPPDAYDIESKTGIRRIKRLDLFEYSPVLFGAMSLTGTLSIKSLADVKTFQERQKKAAALEEANEGIEVFLKQHKAGNAQALIDWYNEGADGQIDWGTEGDFDDCVRIARGHDLDDPEAFCAERHRDATGENPGSAPGEGDKAGGKAESKEAPAGSYEERQEALYAAVRGWSRGLAGRTEETWTYIVATYEDRVVVCVSGMSGVDPETHYSLPYTFTDDTVTLGEPTPVKVTVSIEAEKQAPAAETKAKADDPHKFAASEDDDGKCTVCGHTDKHWLHKAGDDEKAAEGGEPEPETVPNKPAEREVDKTGADKGDAGDETSGAEKTGKAGEQPVEDPTTPVQQPAGADVPAQNPSGEAEATQGEAQEEKAAEVVAAGFEVSILADGTLAFADQAAKAVFEKTLGALGADEKLSADEWAAFSRRAQALDLVPRSEAKTAMAEDAEAKAWVSLPGSYEDTSQRIYEAIAAERQGNTAADRAEFFWIEATFPDKVIVNVSSFTLDEEGMPLDMSEGYVQYPWKTNGQGGVTLGEPQDVNLTGTVSPKSNRPADILLKEAISRVIPAARAQVREAKAISTEDKEGRVLSSVNAQKIKDALNALIDVLRGAGVDIDEKTKVKATTDVETEPMLTWLDLAEAERLRLAL